MIDLRPQDLSLVLRLVALTVPASVEIWAYGSRVNGNAYDGSDLDLVLRSPDLQEIPPASLNHCRTALTESNLPIFVDVHDWARLPASFHERILTRYEVLRPSAAITVPA